MSEKNPISKRSYFVDESSVAAFNTSFTLILDRIQQEAISQYLAPENTHRFQHGGNWCHPGAPDISDSELKTHSAEIATHYQDLIENDLNAITRCVNHLSETMQKQFEQMLFSTVSETCDRSGNVVDAKKAGSLTDAFMAVMEKIQFQADKNGEISMPQLHTNADVAARMKVAFEKATPEFKERLEGVIARKREEALEREAERKAKFVRYGGSE